MTIDLETALRLADEAETLSVRESPLQLERASRTLVPALASTVRGLVERVRELELAAGNYGAVLRRIAKCSPSGEVDLDMALLGTIIDAAEAASNG